jgi:hypothetical protein
MTLIAVTGALLHPQLRSPQVTSHQKSVPAMPITLIIAADNFPTRHHVYMRNKLCCADGGQPQPPQPDKTLSGGTKGHTGASSRL